MLTPKFTQAYVHYGVFPSLSMQFPEFLIMFLPQTEGPRHVAAQLTVPRTLIE